MAGVTYKEEIISKPTYDLDVLDYFKSSSSHLNSEGESWSQVFYLEASLLLIKVSGSEVELEQIFWAVNEDLESVFQPDEIKNLEESMMLKIILPSALLRNIGIHVNSDFFALYMATVEGKVYKFCFKQNWPFLKSRRNFLGMAGYSLDNIEPVSFCLIASGEEDDVCFGLANGSLCFALLPPPVADHYTKPIQITEIGPPSNLLKAFSNMLRQQKKLELIWRVEKIQKNQLICLSSMGFLRLYDTQRPALLSEIDLGSSELRVGEYKFCRLPVPSNPCIAVGYKVNNYWHAALFRVENSEIKYVTDFNGKENEELIDLSISEVGLWSVWSGENSPRVEVWSFSNKYEQVYIWDTDFLYEHLRDQDTIENSLDHYKAALERICIPGRFTKNILEKVLSKYVHPNYKFSSPAISDEIQHEVHDPNTLLKILDEAKLIQISDYSITSFCAYSEEIGDFLPIIIRGNSTIGILRKTKRHIEAKSLKIEQIACKFSKINQRFDQKEISEFKFYCDGEGLENAMCIARIWRKGFQSIFDEGAYKSFPDAIKKIVSQPIPYHMLQLLTRSLSKVTPMVFSSEVIKLQKLFTPLAMMEFPDSVNYWPPFMSIFAGKACNSLVRSYNEYILDLIAIGALATTTIREVLNEMIHERLLFDLAQISHAVFLLSKTLNTPVKEIYTVRTYFPALLFKYEFPLSISSLYILENSPHILGGREGFSVVQLSIWVRKIVSRSRRRLLFSLPLQTNSSCPNIAKTLVNANQTETAISMLNLLQVKNAATEYLKGLSYMYTNPKKSQEILLGIDAILEYDMDDKSKEDFDKGPWMRHIGNSALAHVGGFQLRFHDSLYRAVDNPDIKKEIALSTLSTCTIKWENSDVIKHCLSQLIPQKSYHAAFSLLLTIEDEIILADCLEALLNNACESNEFYQILSIPMSPTIKEICIKILKTFAYDEHFDLKFEKYPAGLFPEIEPQKLNKMRWYTAFYTFCMFHLHYSPAAELCYLRYSEIKYYSKTKEFDGGEEEFLKKLQKEALLLCSLAVRSISSNAKECWFLVTKANQSSDKKRKINGALQKENKIIREIIRLEDIEENLRQLL
ncbi:unnamed protein product [Blepharisma stoltei]|uniref:Nucleoporin Nup120/160 beta-propeller domain-containing protein n=1 Tax=Blepharisma stoltei TaxID=1481888 RepID=A0AAU9IKT8_9CILI|nr:unnamed protein product [Blepharisma stoltei]